MKNIFKGLGVGFVALALILGMGASSANAALTLSALTMTSNGALTLNAAHQSVINIGSTGEHTITIGNVTDASGINIFAGTDGIVIRTAAASSLGVEISGGDGPITIGTDATVKTITIGSTNGATALNLTAGSGSINLTGQVTTAGAMPVFTQSAGTPTYMATSTDTAGWVRSDTTSHTTVVVTFATAYTIAPHCTFSPDNAAAAALVGSAGGVYGTTTTTALTITHAADTTQAAWNYICIGSK